MQKELEIIKNAKKVILAYSGGLDTSVLVKWLKEQGAQQVICVTGDYGQVADVAALEVKARLTGADKFIHLDLRQEFLEEYAFPMLAAGAKYENIYLLGTAIARPLLSKKLVEIAREEGTDVICHGCTGKGNDQVRFEMGVTALAPEMKVVAPWRFWTMRGRSEEIAYAAAQGIPLQFSAEEDYSMDENNWHLSHEGLDLENPEHEANLKKILHWVTTPEEAPDAPEYVEVGFEQGMPVSLNGQRLEALELVAQLNALGAKHGIGIDDLVESRLVGMKSRGVYENPAASILYFAHEKLESLTLDADTLHFKQSMALEYGKLVYNGKWFTTLRQSLQKFVEETQKYVTGSVKVKLYKGGLSPAGIFSPYSLFSQALATFEADDVYNQGDATGFINLFGLSQRTVSAQQWKKDLQ